MLTSARTTNEDNYIAQKFMRAVLKTNNVDHCARLCHAGKLKALYIIGEDPLVSDPDKQTMASWKDRLFYVSEQSGYSEEKLLGWAEQAVEIISGDS